MMVNLPLVVPLRLAVHRRPVGLVRRWDPLDPERLVCLRCHFCRSGRDFLGFRNRLVVRAAQMVRAGTDCMVPVRLVHRWLVDDLEIRVIRRCLDGQEHHFDLDDRRRQVYLADNIHRIQLDASHESHC